MARGKLYLSEIRARAEDGQMFETIYDCQQVSRGDGALEITLTIPDNVATEIENGNNAPLDRSVLELAAIQAHESDLITEVEVMEMLGFEDREELYEFFKRHRVRSKHTSEDFENSNAALDDLLRHGHR